MTAETHSKRIDDSFRIGCIGALGSAEMAAAIAAVKATLEAMGIDDLAPMPMAITSN